MDTGSEDTRTRSTWNWRQLHQPIVFSNMDLAKNGGGEATKVFDLLKTETEDARLALEDKLGTAMWTAQSGDQMDSLLDAVDDGEMKSLCHRSKFDYMLETPCFV